MQILSRPASQGFIWLTDGMRLVIKQPIALFAMVFLTLMGMSLPSIIPGIGPILSVAILPALYVGLMHAIRATELGQAPNPAMLITAFKPESGNVWQPLLMLGAINAVLTIVVLGIVSMIGSPDLMSLSEADREAAALEDPLGLITPMLLFAALYTPVQMAFWYAPLFVAWHRTPVGKSIFFSIVAVWRNKWAFAALFLGWFGIVLAAVIVLRLLVGALGLSSTAASILLSPLSLFGLTAAYCSFWVSYRDVIR